MSVTWETRWRWDTGYNADSVEWCPVEPYTGVLACGTYQLDKKDGEDQSTKQKRLGRIYLFVISEETKEISPTQTIETSGVLDQKWCYHTIQNRPVLAVVTSEGFLQVYRLVNVSGTLSLELWIEEAIGQDILGLSLDWSNNKYITEEPNIVVSDSGGFVKVFKIHGDGLKMVREWKAHNFEAWIAAFNYWDTNVVYSGGDDSVMKTFDVRLPDAAAVNRDHLAGVTSVRTHLQVEHQLLTGSYDEKTRLWDARQLKRCITETDVNGGVWRLKYHPSRPCAVLAACMYGGFRVLNVDTEIHVTCEYLEHSSIAYGADWQFASKPLVGTCSFYDSKLHIGEVSWQS